MERVEGVAGVFIRSGDPERLRAWYAEHLGIESEDWGGRVFTAAAGQTFTWAVFPGDTDYFPGQVMINFRVRDLDALLAQLRAGRRRRRPERDGSRERTIRLGARLRRQPRRVVAARARTVGLRHATLCGDPWLAPAMNDDLDQRLLDGIKITTDAYKAGEIDALRDAQRLAEQLVRDLQTRITALEAERAG